MNKNRIQDVITV